MARMYYVLLTSIHMLLNVFSPFFFLILSTPRQYILALPPVYSSRKINYSFSHRKNCQMSSLRGTRNLVDFPPAYSVSDESAQPLQGGRQVCKMCQVNLVFDCGCLKLWICNGPLSLTFVFTSPCLLELKSFGLFQMSFVLFLY